MGGVLPISFLLVFEHNGWVHLIPNYYAGLFTSWYAMFVCVSFPAMFPPKVITNWLDPKLPGSITSTDVLMSISAGMSICSLHAFVMATGGPIQSFLSFHYLYIFAVVTLVFRDRFTLYTTAALLTISFSLNLFGVPHWFPYFPLSFNESLAPEWRWIVTQPAYTEAYFCMFILQLCVALGIAISTRRVTNQGQQVQDVAFQETPPDIQSKPPETH